MDSVDYQPFYCEENVYRIAARRFHGDRRLARDGFAGPGAYAVFVSNPRRTVALTAIRAGRESDGLIVFDYHVFYLEQAGVVEQTDAVFAAHEWLVFDPDSRLGMPLRGGAYLASTFPEGLRDTEYAPRFVLVPAPAFLTEFASDRSHMRRPDGTWIHPPPPWPAIRAERGSNLFAFVDGDHPCVAWTGTAERLQRLAAMRRTG